VLLAFVLTMALAALVVYGAILNTDPCNPFRWWRC